MKTLEKGKDKVREICDALRRETMEPAQQEAKQIITDAKAERDRIVQHAEREAEGVLEAARVQIEKERQVFKSSMEQASKQALEALRQSIEHELFHPAVIEAVDKRMADPEIIAKLIQAIVKSVENEGLNTDISALVPKTVSAEKVNAALAKDVLDKLKEGAVKVGDFSGGTQVKLIDKKMTIDISSKALVDLLVRYIRDDFRQLFFKAL